MNVNIYTDGGCKGNPGPGAWAFVCYSSSRMIFLQSGSIEYTTNNRMELFAVLQALQYCILRKEFGKVTIFTDSQYVQKGITKWIIQWEQQKWRTSGKKEVKNKDLWKELLNISKKMKVSWQWIKGHSNSLENNTCHNLVQKELFFYSSST